MKMREFFLKEIYGLTYDNEKIYFVTNTILAILYYDCADKRVKVLTRFPQEIDTVCAFEKIIKYNQKIYLFPCLARQVFCYDIDKKKYDKLDIFDTVIDKMPERKILEVLVYRKRIYCVCQEPIMVICINPDSEDFQVYLFSDKRIYKEKTGFTPSVIAKDNNLIFPYKCNSLIEFNIDTGIFQINSFNGNIIDNNINNYIVDMCIDRDGVFWLCSFDGQLYKLIDGIKVKIEMPKEITCFYNAGGFGNQRRIDKMFIAEDELCFSLRSECRILRFDIKKEEYVWNFNNLNQWNDSGIKMAYINYIQIDNTTYWLYNRNDYALYKWNLKKGFIEKLQLKILSNELLKVRFAKEHWVIFCDEEDTGLGCLLNYIKTSQNHKRQETIINYGFEIYKSLID